MHFDHLRREFTEILLASAECSSRGIAIPHDVAERRVSVQLQLDSIVYPILTLPTEITSEIFVSTLAKRRHAMTLSPLEAPLLLMQICTAWRAIALSTLRLWATLTVSLKGYQRRLSPNILPETFDRWVTCVCATPVVLNLYGDATDKDAEHMSAILHRHGSQLEDLRLSLYPVDLGKLAEPLPLDALKSLSLTLPGLKAGGTSALRAFENTPHLRDLSLGVRPHHFMLPYSQLTSFTGDDISEADCIIVLSSAPRLLKCTFNGVITSSAASLPACLTHRAITDFSCSPFPARMIRILDFPALRTLEFSLTVSYDSDEPAPDPSAPLLGFLTHAAHSLRVFAFTEKKFHRTDDPMDWECFRIMTGLTDISFSKLGQPFARKFLLALNRIPHRDGEDTGGAGREFLPRLRRLHMKCQEKLTIDESIVHALGSRYSAGVVGADTALVNLEEVRLVYDKVPDAKEREEVGDLLWEGLLALSEEGMDVHVGTREKNFLRH